MYFEGDYIEIEAKSRIDANPPYDQFDGHYYYYYRHSYNAGNATVNHWQTEPIANFVTDAKNYRDYVTEKLNDIEAEIEV